MDLYYLIYHMTNKENPTGVNATEVTHPKEVETRGEQLLSNLVDAIQKKVWLN